MNKVKWSLDTAHSEIQFKVKHMMVSTVTGHFKTFEANVETAGDDFSNANVNFSADLSSISTNNDQRDAHLKSTDFFDAATHPRLSFVSSGLEKINEEQYKLHGTLTMRGISKPVTFNVEFGGVVQDPWGNTRSGFSVSGKVNRKDFGIAFSMVSDSGSILLGEEVTIHANAEFVKEQVLQTA